MDHFISSSCGLTGVSGGISDVRELLARRGEDPKAADALDLFCYTAKKWIGAYAAVLGGLDTLVFSGGIGEHAPEIRAQICRGMEWLGMEIDAGQNMASAPVISSKQSRAVVRVIPTDEEGVMARIVLDVISSAA
jgi:acetate kinase